MMNKEELQTAICNTLASICDTPASANETLNLAHFDGILRGLLLCYTGEDPAGESPTSSVDRICQLADIPHRLVGDIVYYFDNEQQVEETKNMNKEQLDVWLKEHQ